MNQVKSKKGLVNWKEESRDGELAFSARSYVQASLIENECVAISYSFVEVYQRFRGT